MSTILINNVDISQDGWSVKNVTGYLALSERKNTESLKESHNSVNYYNPTFRQKSHDVTIEIFGKFNGIAVPGSQNQLKFEKALYNLYGELSLPGEHTISHTDNLLNTITFQAILMRGATVDIKFAENTYLVSVTLKLLKTKEYV